MHKVIWLTRFCKLLTKSQCCLKARASSASMAWRLWTRLV